MKETNNKSGMIIAVLEAAVAVFLLLVVTKIAPVCTGMLELVSGKQVHMKCYYTSLVLIFLAILFLVNAIASLIAKQKFVSGIMNIALAIFVFVALNGTIGIGVCMNPEMACNVTAPFAQVCGAIELVLGAVSAYLGMKELKN